MNAPENKAPHDELKMVMIIPGRKYLQGMRHLNGVYTYVKF